MDKYTLRNIIQIIEPQVVTNDTELNNIISETIYDTRALGRVEEGIFVALKSPKRNGHLFVKQAYSKGIRAFLVSEKIDLPNDATILLVENTLQSLQKLATFHRQRFDYPVLAITGSNGKTIVKEWLADVLDNDIQLVKSPKSYNSQLGVALSLLEMQANHQCAIIEAGISQLFEMQILANMIKPTIGILTHIGDAHSEGFTDKKHKLIEKLSLFKTATIIFANADDDFVYTIAKETDLPFCWIGRGENAHYRIENEYYKDNYWHFKINYKGENTDFRLHQTGLAALENAVLVIAAAHYIGLEMDIISQRIEYLTSVSMRTELITDNPEITLINDSYNADKASVMNAFSLLETHNEHPHKYLILSDLGHQGSQQKAVQLEVLNEAIKRFGIGSICLVGEVYYELIQEHPELSVLAYKQTEDLIKDFYYEPYRNSVVWLKGGRYFSFEKLIPYLTRRAGQTFLKINLNALKHNYNTIRNRLPEGVGMIAMLKAAGYGSGGWQLAQELERDGVEYIAVAYTNEGIELRQKGIQTPILVLNADEGALELLIEYQLEPVVGSFNFLERLDILSQNNHYQSIKIHIEFDTGIARLGFSTQDANYLLNWLSEHNTIKPTTLFTHLVASENPNCDDFTLKQIQVINDIIAQFQIKFPDIQLHIFNTAGILRFNNYSKGLVRLGIGLYGITPSESLSTDLEEIASLHSVITQIRTLPAGANVGYGHTTILDKETTLATVALGYADGIPYSIKNLPFYIIVREQFAPVIGNVCMDMLMIDITDIQGVSEGDSVVVFGSQGNQFQSIWKLAKAAGTIPYEILTGIGSRVRRIYVKE